jgi:hypothetical protein
MVLVDDRRPALHWEDGTRNIKWKGKKRLWAAKKDECK